MPVQFQPTSHLLVRIAGQGDIQCQQPASYMKQTGSAVTDPRPRSKAPGTVPHDAVRRSFFCCIKGANNLGAKARLWVSRRWQEVKLRIPDTGLSKLIVELHPTSSLLLFSLRMLPSGA